MNKIGYSLSVYEHLNFFSVASLARFHTDLVNQITIINIIIVRRENEGNGTDDVVVKAK